MSSLVYRDEAKTWASELIHRESRGPGDTENAMRRLETRYGISFQTFWSLRYRPPKDIMASAYFRLRSAWEDARLRQLKALQNDIEITKIIAGPDRNSIHAAEALVDAREIEVKP